MDEMRYIIVNYRYILLSVSCNMLVIMLFFINNDIMYVFFFLVY